MRFLNSLIAYVIRMSFHVLDKTVIIPYKASINNMPCVDISVLVVFISAAASSLRVIRTNNPPPSSMS